MKFNLITVLGPTAVGKTKIAAQLAHRFNGEIISADSRQVYKRMNIGTGKDYDDYIVQGNKINYYLIDIAEPSEEFNLYQFIKKFNEAFAEIKERKKLPFLVGGTGLYLNSILRKYNLKEADFDAERINGFNEKNEDDLRKYLKEISADLHNTTDLIDKERLIRAIMISESENRIFNKPAEVNAFVIGINEPRGDVKNRITLRLKKRLKEGMIEEVEALLASGITHEKLAFFGLEYKLISLYLKKELSYNDMFQKLNSAIHNFAKRQMTWFRKMEREGIKINWIDGADYEKAEQLLQANINIQ